MRQGILVVMVVLLATCASSTGGPPPRLETPSTKAQSFNAFRLHLLGESITLEAIADALVSDAGRLDVRALTAVAGRIHTWARIEAGWLKRTPTSGCYATVRTRWTVVRTDADAMAVDALARNYVAAARAFGRLTAETGELTSHIAAVMCQAAA